MNELNRRHKAALCATLVSVGLIFAYDGRVHVAIGVGLLGVAYSWVLGSDRRAVHWLLLACGLLLLSAPVGDAFSWPRSKAGLIKNQTELINSNRYTIEIEKKSQHDLESNPDPKVRAAARDELADYSKRLVADYRELESDEEELHRLERETTLRHTIEVDWDWLLSGAVLFFSGLGLLLGIKVRTAARADN